MYCYCGHRNNKGISHVAPIYRYKISSCQLVFNPGKDWEALRFQFWIIPASAASPNISHPATKRGLRKTNGLIHLKIAKAAHYFESYHCSSAETLSLFPPGIFAQDDIILVGSRWKPLLALLRWEKNRMEWVLRKSTRQLDLNHTKTFPSRWPPLLWNGDGPSWWETLNLSPVQRLKRKICFHRWQRHWREGQNFYF